MKQFQRVKIVSGIILFLYTLSLSFVFHTDCLSSCYEAVKIDVRVKHVVRYAIQEQIQILKKKKVRSKSFATSSLKVSPSFFMSSFAPAGLLSAAGAFLAEMGPHVIGAAHAALTFAVKCFTDEILENETDEQRYERIVNSLNMHTGTVYCYQSALRRLKREYNSEVVINTPDSPPAFIDKVYTPHHMMQIRKNNPYSPILTIDQLGNPYLDGDWTYEGIFNKQGACIEIRPAQYPIHSHKHPWVQQQERSEDEYGQDKETIKNELPAVPAAGGSPDPEDPFGDKKRKQEESPQKPAHRTDAEAFKKALEYATSPIKLRHFFKKPEHLFQEKFNIGASDQYIPAQIELVKKVIEQLMKSSKLPEDGNEGPVKVMIDGIIIEANVFMHEQIIKIGTMYIPPLS